MNQTKYLMKPLLLIPSILLLLFSCGDKIVEKVEETYPNNKPKTTIFYKVVDEKEVKVREKDFYENGKVKMEGEIKDEKRTGIWKAYYDNGQLWSEGEFLNGERTGKAKIYFPNGIIDTDGNYTKGKPSGTWKYYNEQGILVEEVVK